MKWPSKTIQNLLYFWNTKTHVFLFLIFDFCYFIFFLMNALVYVDIDIREKNRVAQKKLHWFLYSKNMAKFSLSWSFHQA